MRNGQSAYDATAGGLNFRVYLEKKIQVESQTFIPNRIK